MDLSSKDQKMLKHTLLAAALVTAAPALAEIDIQDAYARTSSPVAKSGAAFMVVQNVGGSADRLIDVSSDVAAKTELHTHAEDENGVMRMLHVEEGFELPADGQIIMRRGGKHVMFMGVNAPFEQGDTVSVTLTFREAGDIEIEIPVDLDRQDHGGMGHDMDG